MHAGIATGQVQKYTGTGALGLPHLTNDFMRTGQVIPLFKHTLIIIGRICDADCKFVFTEQSIVVYDMKQQPLITGQREPNGTNL